VILTRTEVTKDKRKRFVMKLFYKNINKAESMVIRHLNRSSILRTSLIDS